MIDTSKNQGEDRRRGGPTDTTTAHSGLHCPDSSGEHKVCSTLLILRSGAERTYKDFSKMKSQYDMFVDAVGARQVFVSVSVSHKIMHYIVNRTVVTDNIVCTASF